MATVIPLEELFKELVALIVDNCPDEVLQAKLIGIAENWLVKGSLADAGKAFEDIKSMTTSCLNQADIIRVARMILQRRIDDKMLELAKT